MLKVFKIWQIVNKEVCVPIEDYYRPGTYQTETVKLLNFIEEFESEEQCISYIAANVQQKQFDSSVTVVGDYLITIGYKCQ